MHAREKASTTAMPPYHAKGKAATSHVFADESIVVQEHLAPPDRIQHTGLNKDKLSMRAKESSSCVLPRKHLGKLGMRVSILNKHNEKDKTCPPDCSMPSCTHAIKRPVKTESLLAGDTSQKPTHKVTPQKHSTKEVKACPPGHQSRHTQGIKTEASISQKRTGSIPHKHNAMEVKTCPPGHQSRHTQGIKTEASMSQKRTGSIPHKHKAMEKTCPPDQLRRHIQGIQRPVKTEALFAREKKHTKSNNTSSPTERTTPQLTTRTSSLCSDARPIDAQDNGNMASVQEQKEESATVKADQDVDGVIQKLNTLGLGEDIGFEEYYGYLEQLPLDPYVRMYKELSPLDRYHMDLRHAVYRIKSFKLLKKEFKNELCRDKLKDCPMDLLDKDEFTADFLEKMKYFHFFQHKGVLDWFFHPDLCKLADLNDYQRLVPRNHGNHEYAAWDAYRSYFHTYEMQHEYIKYFETLLRELKWLKDCLPRKFSSFAVSKMRTRGIYQATKIATRFSKITPHLTHIGFGDCLSYMDKEAIWCNGSEDLYFEIWKRVTQQKESFKDTLKEVYKLNKCPSLQESVKYAIDDDCTVMKCAFLRCTAGADITNEVPVDKAQEMIAEAVKKLRIKPKFYDGYIRKKIEIAQPIGLITEG